MHQSGYGLTSLGSTIAPTQCDGLVTLGKCCPVQRAHTEFHDRAFTVLVIVLEPHYVDYIVASSGCNMLTTFTDHVLTRGD